MTLHELIQAKARSITPFIERSLKDDEKFEALNLQDTIEDSMIEIAAAALELARDIYEHPKPIDFGGDITEIPFLETLNEKIQELKGEK